MSELSLLDTKLKNILTVLYKRGFSPEQYCGHRVALTTCSINKSLMAINTLANTSRQTQLENTKWQISIICYPYAYRGDKPLGVRKAVLALNQSTSAVAMPPPGADRWCYLHYMANKYQQRYHSAPYPSAANENRNPNGSIRGKVPLVI